MPLANRVGGGGGTPQLCEQIDNFAVTAGMLTATLTWTAPTTDEDDSFVGTRIVRKVGSTPQSKADGTVVYEGTALTYTDTGLTEDTTYYYRAFAYNMKKKYQTAMRVVSLVAQSVSTTLNDNSWDVIKSVSDEGNGANYWSIGDCKQIKLDGTVGALTLTDYYTYAFIIGFNHNASLEGENRIHFQIGKTALTDGNTICLCDTKYDASSAGTGYFCMNPPASDGNGTNTGGWESSYMRTTILGKDRTTANTLFRALPADLYAYIKPVVKYTDNTGGSGAQSDYVTATTDYLFLLSEYELTGVSDSSNTFEQNKQMQYAYYAAGNDRTIYKHNATSTKAACWLRSRTKSSTISYCTFYSTESTSGLILSASSILSQGISPCFCI